MTIRWRAVLIDWPARIVDGWWLWYWRIVAVGVVVLWSVLIVGLLLWYVFGIRWGW